MIKTCIFDFDGTLVDSQKDVFESLNHAFVSCGITVKALDPEIIMQQHLPDAIKSAAPEITGEQCERVISAFKEHYDKSNFPNTRLMPGALDLLIELKERAIPCFIISNKRRIPMLRILDKFKLRAFFTDIFNPDRYSDQKAKKTKSQLIAAAIEKHNLPKAETAYIGDMEVDVIAAKENGLIAVAVINGYGKVATYRIQPDFTMRRISEVLSRVACRSGPVTE
jgi:phosphoglycolate phosphatase